jgi:hypothetical protein
MKIETKYELNKTVFIIEYGINKTFKSTVIRTGKITEIKLQHWDFEPEGKKLKTFYHIKYLLYGIYHHSVPIPEKRVFQTLEDAELFIFDKFIKNKKNK